MRIFYTQIDAFLNEHTNDNDCEIIDAIDGVLTDTYLINYRGHLILAVEHYLNAWASNHHCYMAKLTNKRDIKRINSIWDNLVLQDYATGV